MATEVKSWRANDGSLHDDKVAAAQRDVELLVASIMWAGADVDHISEKLIENREHVIRVLTEYHRLAPPNAVKGEASSESGEGPVVNIEQSAEPMAETEMQHGD
jgi:hypothetical protein